MVREQQNRSIQVRFSLLSFVGLMLCWGAVSALSFYGGTLVGRMSELNDQIERAARIEKMVAEEEQAPLSFPQALSQTAPAAAPRPVAVAAPGKAEPKKSDASEASDEPAAAAVSGTAPVEEKVLQVGSFRDLGKAQRLVQSLRGKGHAAFMGISGPAGSDPNYRVYVGPFPDGGAAARTKDVLEKQEGFRGILLVARPEGGARP
ncbi:MAG: SPOR domain-containing protein [bacterium]